MSKALDKLRRSSRVLDSERHSQPLPDLTEAPTNNPRKSIFDDSRGRSKKALGQQLYRQRFMETIDESVHYSQEYQSLFRSPAIERESPIHDPSRLERTLNANERRKDLPADFLVRGRQNLLKEQHRPLPPSNQPFDRLQNGGESARIIVKLCSFLRSGDTYQLTVREIEPPQRRQMKVLVVVQSDQEWHLGRLYELMDVRSYATKTAGRVFTASKTVMI